MLAISQEEKFKLLIPTSNLFSFLPWTETAVLLLLWKVQGHSLWFQLFWGSHQCPFPAEHKRRHPIFQNTSGLFHMMQNKTTYLRLLLLTLWLLKKLLSTELQDGRQLLLVEWCRTAWGKKKTPLGWDNKKIYQQTLRRLQDRRWNLVVFAWAAL